MFNSRHRFNYRPGQVGICLQAWRMLERHFHKCSFQGSGRGQGDITKNHTPVRTCSSLRDAILFTRRRELLNHNQFQFLNPP